MSASPPVSRLAYFWGDDAFSIHRAADRLAHDLAGSGAPPLETWRVDAGDLAAGGSQETEAPSGAEDDAGSARPSARRGGPDASGRRASLLAEIEMRAGTAPLFGDGVLVVLREPAGLAATKADRERLAAILGRVAPGNGLAFCEVLESGAKDIPAATRPLRDAVQAAGGIVRRFEAPKAGRLDEWIRGRASELDIRIEPPAIALLSERVGGAVREGDVDRRRQTELADAELRKLALYRPDAPILRDDVAALVSPSVPASTWALLDEVARRRAGRAADLANRSLSEGAPLPVLVVQLHRRLRQLLQLRSYLDGGGEPGGVIRLLGLRGGNPGWRAQLLTEQADAWTVPELEAALEGLLEVDLASKGIGEGGRTAGNAPIRGPLALDVWLAERVRRR